jgi:hypothetical protein
MIAPLKRHDRVSIALVTAGTFRYRTDTGEGILYPGAFLLGNAGACYECGHEHSHGDRCLSLHIDRELFGEIAPGSSGSKHCVFRTATLPAVPDPALVSVSLQQAATPETKLALEDVHDARVVALREPVAAWQRQRQRSMPRLASHLRRTVFVRARRFPMVVVPCPFRAD